MPGEALLFLFAVVMAALLLFVMVFFVGTLVSRVFLFSSRR